MNASPDPDAAAMAAVARNGDAGAFSWLVEKYRAKVLNFFLRQGVSIHDGEDLAQQTFIRVWKARAGYSPDARFSTFLFTVARSARVDDIRRKDARRRVEEGWRENRDVLAAAGAPRRAGAAVRAAVAALSPPLREVVELAGFQEMPYAEVSAVLGIPEGTVKSRMFNAVAKLKAALSAGKKDART